MKTESQRRCCFGSSRSRLCHRAHHPRADLIQACWRENREPAPGASLPLCAYIRSPSALQGEDLEQAALLSGAPTKNRDSTLPLALSNKSMNREDTQKLLKVSEQRETGRGEGKEPEERALICISVHTQAHTYMGPGRIVWRVINKYFIKQKGFLSPHNSTLPPSPTLSSCNLIFTARCW